MIVNDMATEHLIENTWKTKRRVHTVEDLFNIPLIESVKPVKCIIDPINPYNSNAGEFKLDKVYKSWILYNA